VAAFGEGGNLGNNTAILSAFDLRPKNSASGRLDLDGARFRSTSLPPTHTFNHPVIGRTGCRVRWVTGIKRVVVGAGQRLRRTRKTVKANKALMADTISNRVKTPATTAKAIPQGLCMTRMLSPSGHIHFIPPVMSPQILGPLPAHVDTDFAHHPDC
jgi:hypothetical protein